MTLRRRKSTHGPSEIWDRPALVRSIAKEQRRVGQEIRSLRHQNDLTQEEAAEAIGLHPKYLGEIELGKVNPSLAVLVAIAEAFGVKLKLFA